MNEWDSVEDSVWGVRSRVRDSVWAGVWGIRSRIRTRVCAATRNSVSDVVIDHGDVAWIAVWDELQENT